MISDKPPNVLIPLRSGQVFDRRSGRLNPRNGSNPLRSGQVFGLIADLLGLALREVLTGC